MLPFGKLRRLKGTRAQVTSRWLETFERSGCEVTRDGDSRLHVRIPGWDAALGSDGPVAEATQSIARHFWDRMTVTVAEDGTARYRLDYLTPVQLAQHLGIALIFAVGLPGAGGGAQARSFALAFGIAQLIPWVISMLGFAASRRALNRAAVRETD